MQLVRKHGEAHFLLSVRSRRRQRSLFLPLSSHQPVVLGRLERVGGPGSGRVEVRRQYRAARAVVVVVVVERAEAGRRQRRPYARRRQVTAAAALRLVPPDQTRRHSAERIPTPRHCETGTASLPASSKYIDLSFPSLLRSCFFQIYSHCSHQSSTGLPTRSRCANLNLNLQP